MAESSQVLALDGARTPEPGLQRELDEAMGKIERFLSGMYGNETGYPELVRERLAKLRSPESVVKSDDVLRGELAERGTGMYRDRVTMGFYDSDKDRIVMRTDAGSKALLHEMLHFVSADVADREGVRVGFLIKRKVGEGEYVGVNAVANEAMTVVLTEAIDRGLDIFSPDKRTAYAALKETKLGLEKADLARSYADPALALVGEMREMVRIGTSYSGLGKHYIDPSGWQRDEIGVLLRKIEAVPRRRMMRALEGVRVRLADLGLGQETQKSALSFLKYLETADGGAAFFYPENSQNPLEPIRVYPWLDGGAVAQINLDLPSLFADGFYYSHQGAMAYIYWSSLKFEAARAGDFLDDRDFYSHPKMVRFLSAIDSGDLATEVSRFTRHYLGVEAGASQNQAILESRMARFR